MMQAGYSADLVDMPATFQAEELDLSRAVPTVQQDSWLLSFIDILTLLLTLFVLLLAYKHDGPQDQHLANAATVIPDQSFEAQQTSPNLAIIEQDILPATVSGVEPAIIAEALSTPQQAQNKLLIDLQQSGLFEILEATTQDDIITLQLRDDILFQPASAELSPSGQALLKDLAERFRSAPFRITVEGHTDNRPIHTAQFPSNWDLSASRATTATRTLVTNGVTAQRIRAIGYGDTQPRADNTTEQGRSQNRRVSFVLSPDVLSPEKSDSDYHLTPNS